MHLLEKAYQVLDYLAMHHNATVRFRASNMVMNIYLDASYLSKTNARSRKRGHFFMGSLPSDGKPIKINGAFHTLCLILRFLVASAAKAKLGALFLYCKEGLMIKLSLKDLSHTQPKIPVTATMQQPSALQTIPSNGNNPEHGNGIFLDM
jgi:hypothetical protein